MAKESGRMWIYYNKHILRTNDGGGGGGGRGGGRGGHVILPLVSLIPSSCRPDVSLGLCAPRASPALLSSVIDTCSCYCLCA